MAQSAVSHTQGTLTPDASTSSGDGGSSKHTKGFGERGGAGAETAEGIWADLPVTEERKSDGRSQDKLDLRLSTATYTPAK